MKLSQLLLEEETHRCINGKIVSIDSPACVRDIENRIDDAALNRDACAARTDARMHYNGLLQILRRKLRQSRKMQS